MLGPFYRRYAARRELTACSRYRVSVIVLIECLADQLLVDLGAWHVRRARGSRSGRPSATAGRSLRLFRGHRFDLVPCAHPSRRAATHVPLRLAPRFRRTLHDPPRPLHAIARRAGQRAGDRSRACWRARSHRRTELYGLRVCASRNHGASDGRRSVPSHARNHRDDAAFALQLAPPKPTMRDPRPMFHPTPTPLLDYFEPRITRGAVRGRCGESTKTTARLNALS